MSATRIYNVLACILVFLYALHCQPVDDEMSPLRRIDELNRNLPAEIRSHLEGDIYTETVEADSLSGQSAPLKKWENKRWPNGIVPYVLTSAYDNREKQLIRSGLRDIEASAPCIKFIEYAEGDSRVPATHVLVIKNTGCWSLIGRTSSGKNQKLALDHYCIDETKRTIVHEFLHALGFYHEQARPDRDDYIIIHWDRIYTGGETQFLKTARTEDLDVAYDRVSVMQYPNRAYAKQGEKRNVMDWKADPSLPLGGSKLSSKDILQLNRLYCDDGWVKPATTTSPTRSSTKTTTTTTKPTTTTTKSTTTTTEPTTTTTEPMTTTTKSTTTTKKPTTTTKKPTTTTTEPMTTTAEPTTTKVTKTTQPGNTACGDYKGSCISASPARCSSYQKEICPRKCQVCQGPTEEMCLNLSNTWDDEYCESLGEQDRCQHNVMRTRYRMKTRCAKTCCERGVLYTYSG